MASTVGEQLRRRPDFVRFWTAFTVSGFGTYVTTLAIQVLVVVTLHGGAAQVGIVNAARWLPYLLFGVVAGVFIDRMRRRPVLVVADLVRGVLLLAIPVLALTGALHLAVLAVFMAVFGTMSLAGDVASQSLVPRLVPRSLLPRANARLDTSDAAAQTSGPALAGGLVAWLSAPWAVLVDAASYFASAVLLLRVDVVEPRGRRATVRGVRAEAMQGLRWVYRHPTLTPYAIGNHGWFLVNAVAGTVTPVFALQTLGFSPLGLGVVLSFAGLGTVLGSLVASSLANGFGIGRTVVLGYAGTAVGWAVVAASPHGGTGWVLFAGGQLIIGLTMGSHNASEMGYRQMVTPDALQARTNATVRSINRAMIVVGAPVGGLLADAYGTRTMLVVVAIGFLAVSLGLACTPYRSARMDDVHAAAVHPG